MPPKRSFRRDKKPITTKSRVYKKPTVKALQSAVRRLNVKMNKTIETKRSNISPSDGVEISHNNYVIVTSALLSTSNGTNDPANAQGTRIGDQIAIKGLSIRGMLELNERYTNVTFRLLVVRSAKGDTPSRSTLFNGLSGNKMIDTLNTERYTILAQKWIKMEAPNTGNIYASGAGGAPQPSGYADTIAATQTFSRATRLYKIWIPGSKIVKGGYLTYENESTQPKFFDYHYIIYAYSNYTTLQDYWNVGRINDTVIQLYYKDA